MRSINKNKLLIVEGTHETKFFTTLLEELNLPNIQIEQVGGNYFDTFFKTYADELLKLTSLGILTDADINFQIMFNSITNTLRKYKLPIPVNPNIITKTNPKVSIFIFPNNNDNGALEDLCISSTENYPEMRCVDSYFECLHNINPNYGLNHPHLSKAKVQAYLAKEEEGDIHMGISASKGCWNWNDPVFEPIKHFLTSLFN